MVSRTVMRAMVGVLVTATVAPSIAAQAPRNLLSGRVTPAQLGRMLVSADDFRPFPTIADRAAWDVVPAATRATYVKAAEEQLGQPWGSVPATVMLRFTRDGNRAEYDRMSSGRRRRLTDLVMAEVFENKGRFLDDIANGIWAISEQTFWGSTAHLTAQRTGPGLADVREPVVELFAAEAAAMLAWTDYLLGAKLDGVSPRLRERIRYEVDRRVLTPALERDDFWWMGFGARRNLNNWTPWITSNWLTTVLLLERDSARRERAVHKILRSLDNFLNVYPADGGCDEGPGYWDRAGGSLFDNLELLHTATRGGIDLYGDSLVRNIGRYIHRAYIADNWFVNTGDAAARLTPDAELIFRYGARIEDPTLRGFGSLLRRRAGAYAPGSSTLGRVIPNLLVTASAAAASPVDPLHAQVWLPDLQLMAARATPNSARGFYLSALGAHNGQSHNHNDVGNFIVFADGRPVLVDVGVETYSAKTFSPRRYEIWTMQSAYHNLPTINGVMQKEGAQHRAEQVRFEPFADGVRFSLDIAAAYPADAAVTSWMRTLTLERSTNQVTLDERYALGRSIAPAQLNFVTPLTVDVTRRGEVQLRDTTSDRHFVLRYDAGKFSATTEEIRIDDARLGPVWGDQLARIVLTRTGQPLRDAHRVVLRYANGARRP